MKKLYNNISKKNVDKLLKALFADVLTFNKEEYIPKGIIDSKSIIIILEGYVQIIRNNYNGNINVIDHLHENDVLESAVAFIESNEYEIIAKEYTKIIVIDEYRLMNFEDSSKYYYTEFMKNIVSILNESMKEKSERLQIITKKSIRDRLLEYFYIARKKSGSVNIYLPYSFTDLADYLVVNRSALMRELKNLKNEGFIESKGHKIKLLY